MSTEVWIWDQDARLSLSNFPKVGGIRKENVAGIYHRPNNRRILLAGGNFCCTSHRRYLWSHRINPIDIPLVPPTEYRCLESCRLNTKNFGPSPKWIRQVWFRRSGRICQKIGRSTVSPKLRSATKLLRLSTLENLLLPQSFKNSVFLFHQWVCEEWMI